MMEIVQKLPQWLPALPVAAKIPITVAIVCLAVFFIVILWHPVTPDISYQQIKDMLNECDEIERNWEDKWQEVEPLAKRAEVYIKPKFPEQAAEIEMARNREAGVYEVAIVLRTQLKIVGDRVRQ